MEESSDLGSTSSWSDNGGNYSRSERGNFEECTAAAGNSWRSECEIMKREVTIQQVQAQNKTSSRGCEGDEAEGGTR